MRNKKRTAIWLAGFTAILVFSAILKDKLNAPAVILHGGENLTGKQEVTYLQHDGKQYRLRRDLQTLLLIGTDEFRDEGSEGENDFLGLPLFYNYNHADFIGLLVFDDASETITLIQLNRDSICDVPWLTVNGLVGGTEKVQLSFAHTYGSGGKDSCENTARAVTNMLFGLPVENYAAIPMSALPVLNDIVGGVKVRFEEDYTDISPAYVSGAEVTLYGSDALSFVRARMGVSDGTNVARMSRQRIYINSFLKSLGQHVEEDSLFVLHVLESLGENLVTNVEYNFLNSAADKFQKYSFMPIITPEGKNVSGGKYMEFYPDEEELWNLVQHTFCR